MATVACNVVSVVTVSIFSCLAFFALSLAGLVYGSDRACSTHLWTGFLLILISNSISAVFTILQAVAYLINGIDNTTQTMINHRKKMTAFYLSQTLYFLAAFIYLCAQVFGTSSDKCDSTFYSLGLAYCISVFVLIAVAVLGLIIAVIFVGCLFKVMEKTIPA
jgi:predicted membrane protein